MSIDTTASGPVIVWDRLPTGTTAVERHETLELAADSVAKRDSECFFACTHELPRVEQDGRWIDPGVVAAAIEAAEARLGPDPEFTPVIDAETYDVLIADLDWNWNVYSDRIGMEAVEEDLDILSKILAPDRIRVVPLWKERS